MPFLCQNHVTGDYSESRKQEIIQGDTRRLYPRKLLVINPILNFIPDLSNN